MLSAVENGSEQGGWECWTGERGRKQVMQRESGMELTAEFLETVRCTKQYTKELCVT